MVRYNLSVCKIWSLLKLLEKNRWVLACSYSKIFFPHAGILVFGSIKLNLVVEAAILLVSDGDDKRDRRVSLAPGGKMRDAGNEVGQNPWVSTHWRTWSRLKYFGIKQGLVGSCLPRFDYLGHFIEYRLRLKENLQSSRCSPSLFS